MSARSRRGLREREPCGRRARTGRGLGCGRLVPVAGGQALMPSDWGEASHTRPSRIIDAGSARRKLFIGHIREVERFAAVRERDPGIAQACKVLALVIIVRFFGQRRHPSGRLPSGVALLHVALLHVALLHVALLHVVGSVLASRKTYYTAVGSRRTQLLLNVNRGINSARSSNCRTGRAPIASHPWAGLGVAAEPPSAGRVNASCEGQRRCASSLCQRGNISAHSRRRLGEAILCRPCSES